MKIVFWVVLFFVLAGMAGASGSKPVMQELRAEFKKSVGSNFFIFTSKEKPLSFLREDTLEEFYFKQILKDARGKILSVKAENKSQYFVYVDRNPNKQIIVVGFFDATCQSIGIVGVNRVSTGNPNRPGYFVTPVGIFTHKNDYRAEGTRNAKGWRGLGVKNSRVWDFGWQKTCKNNQPIEIRLLMHATDPDFGEPRLGKVASKGCVRISSKLNKFLDYYGILDSRGKYLLVGDSRF